MPSQGPNKQRPLAEGPRPSEAVGSRLPTAPEGHR